MAIGISGWVEYRDTAYIFEEGDVAVWHGVIKATPLLPQNVSMRYSALFGIENRANWKPTAEGRGIPVDASDEVVHEQQESSADYFGPTWVSWREIEQAPWDEAIADRFVHGYQRNEANEYVEAYAYFIDDSSCHPNMPLHPAENDEWFEDRHGVNYLCRVERITRYEATIDKNDRFGDGFAIVFEMMKILAHRYGEENIRLVVWFGN